MSSFGPPPKKVDSKLAAQREELEKRRQGACMPASLTLPFCKTTSEVRCTTNSCSGAKAADRPRYCADEHCCRRIAINDFG